MRRADDRHQKADEKPQHNRRKRDLERDPEPLDQIFAAVGAVRRTLQEAEVNVVVQRLPHALERGGKPRGVRRNLGRRGVFRLLQAVAFRRVVRHPLVEPPVRLRFADDCVDDLQQVRAPLGDGDRILLGRQKVRNREPILAFYAVFGGIDVRDDEGAPSGEHGRARFGRGLEPLRFLLERLFHERIARRAALHADLLALELVEPRVGFRLAVDDHDARLDVRNREVDVLLAVLGDRDARRGEVRLARNDGGDDGIEIHVLRAKAAAHFLGHGAAEFRVDPDDLLSAQELVRRERRLGRHGERLRPGRGAREENRAKSEKPQSFHPAFFHVLTCPSACRSLR